MSRDRLLVLYGTVEGQSRRIAEFVGARLGRQGWSATLADAEHSPPDPGRFNALVVVAPLHMGRYPRAVSAFLAQHQEMLAGLPGAFVSVSLSAAGRDPTDRAGLERCVAAFLGQTAWKPRAIHHAAGAFRFTRYSPLKRWMLKYIAWRKGQPTDTSRDYELTDWEGLGAFVDEFAAAIPARSG